MKVRVNPTTSRTSTPANPSVVTGNQSSNSTTTISGGGFTVSASQPSDTTTAWVDTGNAYLLAYPIRNYVNGAWGPVRDMGPWWDSIGNVISNGKPLAFFDSGQSNCGDSYYQPNTLQYGSAYTGDITKSPYITHWNRDDLTWHVFDFADSNGTSGVAPEYGWAKSGLGTNSSFTFAKAFVKKYNRSVRFVTQRMGGTAMAAWETGALAFNHLSAVATESGVDHFDAFLWFHGEAGLTDGNYPTSLFSSYRDSFFDFISRLRLLSQFDGKTKILAPSNGLKHQLKQTNTASDLLTDSEGAESTLRQLSSGFDSFSSWIPIDTDRVIQQPINGASTSSTSVNLSTVTAPFSITIGTGLTAYYPINVNNPVAIISRSSPSKNIRGTISAYNNSNGLLTFSTIEKLNGTGSVTDWDVYPQDRYHWTTFENERTGKLAFNEYDKLPNFKRFESFTRNFLTIVSNALTQIIAATPNCDDVRLSWSPKTLNAGTWSIDLSHAGSFLPLARIIAVAQGSAGRTNVEIWVGDSSVAASDVNMSFRYYGTFLGKPFYNRYTGSAALDSRLEKPTTSANGWWLTCGTSGSSDAEFRLFLGANQYAALYENAGNGPRMDFGGTLGINLSVKNTTSKTYKFTEGRSALYGSLAANAAQTSIILVNTPITDIGAFSAVQVELIVTGVTSDAAGYFSVTKKALFTVANFGTVTLVQEGTLDSSLDPNSIITSLAFSVVTGQISATLTRSAVTGTYKFGSIVEAVIRTF